jgi:hypothetical protein
MKFDRTVCFVGTIRLSRTFYFIGLTVVLLLLLLLLY